MSTGIVRLGDVCSGHDGFYSRQCIEASTNVFINGRGVHRVGDKWAVHRNGLLSHPGIAIEGSSTFTVNGRQVMRVGDKINCGSRAATGSENASG